MFRLSFVPYAICIMAFASATNAAEFPTGTLKGTGFKVEKENMQVTDKDLYAYNSSVTIVKRSDGDYEFTILAHLQKSPSTPEQTDKRADVFNVVWETSNSGKLLNRDVAYQNDKTTFTISNSELVLKSWIARNQLWETHFYSLAK